MVFSDLFFLQFVSLCIVGGIVIACLRARSTPNGLPYPPGPTAKSLLFGNLSDIPKGKPWVDYSQWRHLFGDISHFRVLRQHMVILNSLDVAKELLDKRSGTYSDRPHLTMVDIMDWNFNTGLRPYGPQWRNDRRVMHDLLGPSAIDDYKPVIQEKVNDLLYNLLTSPDDFRTHYKTVTVAVIMRMTYGYNVTSKGDCFIDLAESAVKKLSDSVFLGAATVNAVPILRHLPSWFPGAGFKKYANESKELTMAMRDLPFTFAKNTMASGSMLPSFASCLLSTGEDHDFIKNLGATIYSGASDTTSSALGTFFLSMALNPEIQEKAQEEIDNVIGSGRLPTLDDRGRVTILQCYIEAIYREVLRWRPVAPLGVAHGTTEDDTYKGYFVPKDTLVIPNIWQMTRDINKYKEPELFCPERFFDTDGKLVNEDNSFIFGFGRRICPGRHLGSSILWLAIVSVLSTFNIHKKKDPHGKEIPINGEYSDGMISHPLPFECSVTPRAEDMIDLITTSAGR